MADIPLTKFVNHFELDYAISSHRIQSGAVDEPMVVWIDETTKYRAMYVNITRPRQRSHLFFATVPGFNFRNAFPKKKVKFESICLSPEPVRGIIYGIRNNQDEKEYRGLSVIVDGRTAQQQLLHRIAQHKKAAAKGTTTAYIHFRAVGVANLTPSIVHDGQYKNQRALEADELHFIMQVPDDKNLKTKYVCCKVEKS